MKKTDEEIEEEKKKENENKNPNNIEKKSQNEKENEEKKQKNEEKPNKENLSQQLSKNNESYILDCLFKKTNLKSTFTPDNFFGKNSLESSIIQAESLKIAKEAAKELLKSNSLRSQFNPSIPTWTGKNGIAGIETPKKKKFGTINNISPTIFSPNKQTNEGTSISISRKILISPSNNNSNNLNNNSLINKKAISSSSILSNLKKKVVTNKIDDGGDEDDNEDETNEGSGSGSGGGNYSNPMVGNKNVEHEDKSDSRILIKDIQKFLLENSKKGIYTPTNKIVNQFKNRVENCTLFKYLLKQISEFNSSLKGWILKDNYISEI